MRFCPSTISAMTKLRSVLKLALALMVVVIGTLAIFVWRETSHRQMCDQVLADVWSLAKKQPQGITAAEWHHFIRWTNNDVANGLASPTWVSRRDLVRFADELHRRVEGKVDINTIDWIWDEIARISKYGQSYSDQFRPTTPERREQFKLTGG
jgi:hypothetical protein